MQNKINKIDQLNNSTKYLENLPYYRIKSITLSDIKIPYPILSISSYLYDYIIYNKKLNLKKIKNICINSDYKINYQYNKIENDEIYNILSPELEIAVILFTSKFHNYKVELKNIINLYKIKHNIEICIQNVYILELFIFNESLKNEIIIDFEVFETLKLYCTNHINIQNSNALDGINGEYNKLFNICYALLCDCMFMENVSKFSLDLLVQGCFNLGKIIKSNVYKNIEKMDKQLKNVINFLVSGYGEFI